ncbi:PREDICTED: binding partner of ACD11 1-like [Camelina sativa]|uniref:Binding partner of ACD11 1-like n=1 Tax=Camelina sativa TaxID=90675 RepID=A0ABM0ZM53_CAMSA|nr:PREDICTED: binding partner of ACD11 1-like [Camelina sativa]XP_010518377.1 PREDICTED: binding partner of ACD11 1-like [Camelina sativa]XP_019099244.1 PREDICTED: binding partner of ACD11 1-like [Camelina sativa]
MYPCGYVAEVTNLSPQATEKDVLSFFSHCGIVELVEITGYEGDALTAYVTFRDAYALDMAVLLSGAMIVDRTVSISMYGVYLHESNHLTPKEEDYSVTATRSDAFASSPGEVVTVAQQVVKTMMAKGYVLSTDVIGKARALDESQRFSSFVATKLAEISHYIGLTQNIQSSMEVVRSADEKYHFSEFTKSAVLVTGTAAVAAATITGKVAAAAATSVVNSRYFANGALWFSDALGRAAKAAAHMDGGENS